MRYQNVRLRAFGYELPPRVLSSAEIETRLTPVYERLKLPPGRLELMSGIRERRLWTPHTRPSAAAAAAGRKAIAAAGVAPADLECLIFASVSRDMLEPATAAFVHRELGLPPRCLIFDISNACLGFLDGMVMLANMLELGQMQTGLIVAGETAEDLIESTLAALLANRTLTRKSIKSSFASLTIGSGAVALVMERTPAAADRRLVGGTFLANTAHNDLCQGGVTDNGHRETASTLMATDSEELLLRGIETAETAWRNFLAELGWQTESIDAFFCHQVGSAHARQLLTTLNLDPRKNFETLPYLGNVGSVSAPITMAIGLEQGILRPGQRAALLGIGSGINCMMLGIEW
ncbi:MAG: 3-oxoacyl-ACP synthase III [Deltaproteobacteria bacterium RIFOXYD12_FULL_57_12]|nr:MAG: 3-oxoacyl-ACP synthase III [Deltaproteobacteria bacterium RIFOXYD12_FULL_57_12]